MDIDVRHLKLMRYVAEEGSLTKAARRLYLTQPALSHQLRDLERRLGVPLFHRLGKTMKPTPAGRRLLQSARQVLALLEEAENDVRRIASGQAGTIRISTECYTCYHWLPPIIKSFREEFPNVDVQIVAEATHRPIPALVAGDLDIAIVSASPPDDRFRYEPLFEDEKVALMSPTHPLADRAFLKATDFADEHLILYDLEDSSVLYSFLYPAGVRPRRLSQVQITEGILELVKAGLGITVLARWAAMPELKAGTLCEVPIGEEGLHRQWSAALLNGSPPPRYLERFVEVLAQNPIVVQPDVTL